MLVFWDTKEEAAIEGWALENEVIEPSETNHAANLQSTPDAPYRKEWPMAMFKRALRDAVESGKSWIGWTEGEQLKHPDTPRRCTTQ